MAIDNISQDMADLLVTKNFDPKYTDQTGQDSAPGEAKIFSFDYMAGSGKNYGTAVVVVGDDNELSFFFGDNLGRSIENPADKNDWFSFLQELSNFATQHRYTFSPKDLNRLKHTMQGMAAIKEGLFEGYYGTRRVSYVGEQTEARLVIKHNRMIGEDDKRYRYVESLFVETADNERFKLPFTKLSAGRAMLEHVRQGGRPYDIRGQHINEVVQEMAVLARFNRASQQRVFEGVTQDLVQSARQYYASLQENLKSLAASRGYLSYFESWTPADINDQTALVEDLKTMFVEQTLDARIEAALPTLARIQQKGIAMKEAQIFETWINNLSEGTWALPETPEQRAELEQLMSAELIVGPDATNATEQLYDLVGDDLLFDILSDLAQRSEGRANIWDDSDVQNRLTELGIQMPGSQDDDADRSEQDPYDQDDPAPMEESNKTEGLGHAELAQLAHKAYVAATRQGNGVMAAHYLKQYQQHKDAGKKVNENEATGDVDTDQLLNYLTSAWQGIRNSGQAFTPAGKQMIMQMYNSMRTDLMSQDMVAFEQTWNNYSMNQPDAFGELAEAAFEAAGLDTLNATYEDFIAAASVSESYNKTEGLEEAGGMPSSVVKSKQRNADLSDKDFADAHKGKSDADLQSMAWRHGYGKGSSYYVDKRKKGRQGIAAATSGPRTNVEEMFNQDTYAGNPGEFDKSDPHAKPKLAPKKKNPNDGKFVQHGAKVPRGYTMTAHGRVVKKVAEAAGSKQYGVRYKVFAGKEGRLTTKEHWTTSSEKLERAAAKIEELGNFHSIDGYSYPPEPQGMAEDFGGHEVIANRGNFITLKNKNDGKFEIHMRDPGVVGGLRHISTHNTDAESGHALTKLLTSRQGVAKGVAEDTSYSSVDEGHVGPAHKDWAAAVQRVKQNKFKTNDFQNSMQSVPYHHLAQLARDSGLTPSDEMLKHEQKRKAKGVAEGDQSKGAINSRAKEAHEQNLDAAHRELMQRDADGEDMSQYHVNPRTSKIEKKGVEESNDLARMLKFAGVPVRESVLTDDAKHTFDHIQKTYGRDVRDFETTGNMSDALYQVLYDYYADDMPYGTRKARDGDPYEWISNRFANDMAVKESNSGMIMPEADALNTFEASTCNETQNGEYCPEHGLMECGGIHEMGGMPTVAQTLQNASGYNESQSDNAVLARIKSLALLR